jgi:hemolysin activation/secretion protein
MKIIVCLFAIILGACEAQAQRIPESVRREAQRLEERESERLQGRERIFQDSQIRPPTGEPDSVESYVEVDNERCQAVTRVDISGMTRFKVSDYSDVVRRLVGPCTKIADIERLLRAVTNRYVAAGYITSRAIVAPVADNEGILRVTVVEGGVGKVTDANPIIDFGYGGALRHAFPGLTGRRLNLRDLEQGVDQLARLNGSEPTLDIVPGAAAGVSDVNVKRQSVKRWIRPSLTISNDGSGRTGRRIATASLDLDNPIGLADF